MCQIVKWVMAVLLFTGAWQDLKRRELSVWILALMGVVSLISVFFCGEVFLVQRLLGGAIGILFLGISRLTREAIGYGDSWVFFILGIQLGAIVMLQVLLYASLLASVVSLFYLWIRRFEKRATLPFVPFVAVVYLGVLFI